MRNICNIDTTTTPYNLGYCNECKCNNIILLNIVVTDLTNPYLEITKQDGNVENTELLTINHKIIEYELPVDYVYANGTLKIRILADDNYSSDYITFNIPNTLKTTDDIMIKEVDSSFIIRGTVTSSDVSVAQMVTNSALLTDAETEIEVNVWGNTQNVEIGDFVCEPTKNRIKIPAGSAEYVELFGNISGVGYAIVYIVVKDVNAKQIYWRYSLFQEGGSCYFQQPLINFIYKIPDVTKDYYIHLHIKGYNSKNFHMNYGFGKTATFIGAKKIK